MIRLLSYSLLPQFLLLLGLNFIKPVHGDYQSGPAYRFADKVEAVPSEEFYDLLKVDEDLWLAGSGLHRLEDGFLHEVFPDGRYTALAHDPEENHLWFAGPEGIGKMSLESFELSKFIETESGYIWELFHKNGKVWFFGSQGYGWIDCRTNYMGLHVPKVFEPRPLVFINPLVEEGFFVCSYLGLWSVDASGHQIVLDSSQLNDDLVTWVQPDDGKLLLGSDVNLYSWSGSAGETPIPVTSNYSGFFINGISNAVSLENAIAITDFPQGIVFLDRETSTVTGYAGDSSGLNIGDIYKIAWTDESDLFALGTKGVGAVNLAEAHRFFPTSEIFDGDSLRISSIADGKLYLFTEKSWFEFGTDGYRQGEIKQPPHWGGVDAGGNPFYGSVTGYFPLSASGWANYQFSIPVHDLVWLDDVAIAVTNDGLYSVSAELAVSNVYPSDQQLSILGILDGGVYVLNQNGQITSLTRSGERWRVTDIPIKVDGELIDSSAGENRINLATTEGLYRFHPNSGMERLQVQSGWSVQGLDAVGDLLYAGLHNADSGDNAVAVYGIDKRAMVWVPHIKKVGRLKDVLVDGEHLALIGSNGAGWYARDELVPVAVPNVSLDLFLNDDRVNDRTIPNGMHYIDLQVDFRGPAVPSQVQYRINEDRWRNVSLQEPSLPFTGHGKFLVELRAVHPNGVASEPKRIQFGIAPPWYLNPVYQGILLVLAMAAVWGIYMLRHAQLKRMNLWLSNEVKKQTRELEAATAARTNFLAGLSHDIRNPLNGVLMIAETLTRDPPRSGDDARLKDLTEFGIIVDRMLGEILDFSAIDQTNMPMAFIPVSLSDILQSSVAQNQFGIQKALVNMSVIVPPELREVVIKTDRNWMIKILTNLIVNALEYSESERIEVGSVCHKLTKDHVEMEIYVKDWGKGIDDAEKAFVFDRFYRGESGIESGKHGTGLGLSICQEIAHAMGAHLILTDTEAGGCCFTLKGRFERVSGARELDREAVLKSLRGKKVLVVDDLSYNRKSIVEFFRTIGCECDQCENGREALAMLGRNSYDLALLDWDLPGLMGPDIARRHRKAHPGDPVVLVALTAYTDGEKKRISEEAGMNGYISKPLTASRLAYCLANIETRPPPDQPVGRDQIDREELDREIYKHIRECLALGEQYAWEDLRRCAHRLTTLALIRNNPGMQQVCRDLQISAQSENIEEIRIGLAELRQWEEK